MNGWLNGRPVCDWEADIIADAWEHAREQDLRQLDGVLADDTWRRSHPAPAERPSSLLEPPEALL